MNIQMISAHSFSVKLVAEALSQAGGWKYSLYDSDLPEGPDNKPNGPWEEMNNPFGAPVHTVTFFNEQGVYETVIAGLLVVYPQIAWTELEKKLGRKQVTAAGPVAVSTGPVSLNAGDSGNYILGGGR